MIDHIIGNEIEEIPSFSQLWKKFYDDKAEYNKKASTINRWWKIFKKQIVYTRLFSIFKEAYYLSFNSKAYLVKNYIFYFVKCYIFYFNLKIIDALIFLSRKNRLYFN